VSVRLVRGVGHIVCSYSYPTAAQIVMLCGLDAWSSEEHRTKIMRELDDRGIKPPLIEIYRAWPVADEGDSEQVTCLQCLYLGSCL
jgi:hypothetical protein